MSFWDDINPVKLVERAVKAVVDVVKAVVNAVVDVIKQVVATVGSILSKLADWFAQGITTFLRKLWDAAKWVMDVVAEVFGLGKDGWLTEFLTKYVPFAGLLAAAIHGIRGNNAHAEYAALKGASTGLEALATAAGSLGGPLGGMLGGAIGAGLRNGLEGLLRDELDPSVRDKVEPFDLQTMLTDMALGAALGRAGASGAGKVASANAARSGWRGVANGAGRIGLGGVARSAGRRAGTQAAKATAARAGIRGSARGASQAAKNIAAQLAINTGTNLTVKNVGKKVLTNIPKNVLTGLSKTVKDSGRTRAVPKTAGPAPSAGKKAKAAAGAPWAAVAPPVFVTRIVGVLLVLVLIVGGKEYILFSRPVSAQDLPPRVVSIGAPAYGPRATLAPVAGVTPSVQPPATRSTPTASGGGPTTAVAVPPPVPVTTTPAVSQAPSPTPAAIVLRNWTLRLTSGAPQGAENQPILLRFGLSNQKVKTGTVYDPFLKDDLTTGGTITTDPQAGLLTYLRTTSTDPSNGTLDYQGYVSDALDRIEGTYVLTYVENGQTYTNKGDFTMIRKA